MKGMNKVNNILYSFSLLSGKELKRGLVS